MRSDARKKLADQHQAEHEMLERLRRATLYADVPGSRVEVRQDELRALLDALADERVRVEHFKARLLVRYRELDAMRERAESAERTLAIALSAEPPTRDGADA